MSDRRVIEAQIMGERILLETQPGLFSPEHVDYGTLAMLSTVTFQPGMKVMDLGCGCGVVGIVAARICGEENVLMSDADAKAVETVRKNAGANGVGGVSVVLSNGFESIDETGFDLILSNPPYQTDFAVAKHFIEKGFNRLKIGGRMVMVTKRLDWYRNKLKSVFGGVRVREVNGYYVFEAERRTARYANAKKK